MGLVSPPGTIHLWSLPALLECIPPRFPEAHAVQGPHEAACHELLTHPDGPALWDRGLLEGKSQGPLPPSFSPLKGGLTALGRGLGPCPQGQRWDQLHNHWASVQSENVEPLVQRLGISFLFLMWSISKVFVEFATSLLLFCTFWFSGPEACGS